MSFSWWGKKAAAVAPSNIKAMKKWLYSPAWNRPYYRRRCWWDADERGGGTSYSYIVGRVSAPQRTTVPIHPSHPRFELLEWMMNESMPSVLRRRNALTSFHDHFHHHHYTPPSFLHLLDWTRDAIIVPRYNVTNTKDAFHIAVEVPGWKQKDIQVKMDQDGTVLSITGNNNTTASDDGDGGADAVAENKTDKSNDDEQQQQQQRELKQEKEDDDNTEGQATHNNNNLTSSSSYFSQHFALDDPSLDVENVTAKLEDGILTVSVAKKRTNLDEQQQQQAHQDDFRTIPIISTK